MTNRPTVLRRAHRLIGVVMSIPLLLWGGTGLFFHLKPGWSGAYETLAVATDRVELIQTAIGPVRRDNGSLYTEDGAKISPLDVDKARVLVLDAASRARAAERYGAVASVDSSESTVTVKFDGGAVVTLDRNTLHLRQRGSDTDWIDRLYRVHYGQWTPFTVLNRVLGFGLIVSIWLLAGLGLFLFIRRP